MALARAYLVLGVDDEHIYRMAARGLPPSFHVGRAGRFDPQEVTIWLRLKYGIDDEARRKPSVRIRPMHTANQHVA